MSFSLLNTSLYGRILMFVGRNWMFGSVLGIKD